MPTATTPTRDRVSVAPLPSLEDADLVRRAREGDDLAFEEIVRRYRQPLIRYSARQVGTANAEDITQHALAKAAAHLRDDPRPIHLRAWLYRVAHNAAINMRARKDFGHEELSLEIDGVLQPPEVAAQRSEVREVVSEMDRLPERQRTALVLSVFEGLGYDEIATRLDTSPNSVRALLSRARGHLRRTAAALAPLPLLDALMKKLSALAGAGGSQGTLVAGGTAVQAKFVAVAATTVVAGAAAAENVGSKGDEAIGVTPPALVADAPAAPHHAVPVDIDDLLPHVAAPKPEAKAAAPPPEPVAEEPPVQPAPVEEPLPPEPVAEAPPPVDEAPADPAPADPTAGEPKDDEDVVSPGPEPDPADGNNPGPGGGGASTCGEDPAAGAYCAPGDPPTTASTAYGSPRGH